jgi:archaeal flagellin FlaB
MPESVKTLNKENGITGLETAIILIAFVIVASVLSYVVISAGLFSSQKAKAAVNAGLAQTGCTLELKGNVVALLDNATGAVETVSFTVGVVPGGSAIDLTDYPVGTASPSSRLTISYSDAVQQVASLFWEMKIINLNNGDDMLDPGELAVITVNVEKANYAAEMTADLKAGVTFNLDVTPPDGSVLPIERKMPSRVSGLVNLQ